MQDCVIRDAVLHVCTLYALVNLFEAVNLLFLVGPLRGRQWTVVVFLGNQWCRPKEKRTGSLDLTVLDFN